jgi:hypothetical protein
MAMDNNLEVNWSVRLSNLGSHSQEYRMAWNDDYLWNSMLPLAWPCIDSAGISIRPKNQRFGSNIPLENAIAQWSMAIHLLGLGMGWTDIGKGLKTWALKSFSEGFHPILDFLARNFGREMEALEIYFGLDPRSQLRNVLESFRPGDLGITSTLHSFTNSEEYASKAKRFLEGSDGRSKTIGQHLLNGGDALHLEGHCSNSFLGNQNGGSFMGLDDRQEQGRFVSIWTPWYGGWAYRLAMTSQNWKTSALLAPESKLVTIDVEGIGSLGTYVWHPTTNRWFRYTMHYRGFQQSEAHEWGN